MSNRIGDILKIDHIEGSYILMKDKTKKIVVEISSVYGDKNSIFQPILSSIDTDIIVLYRKSLLVEDDYKDYFHEMIERNIQAKLLPEVLAYIKELKVQLEKMSHYSVLFIITMNNRISTIDSIHTMFSHLNVEYEIYENYKLQQFLNTLFL